MYDYSQQISLLGIDYTREDLLKEKMLKAEEYINWNKRFDNCRVRALQALRAAKDELYPYGIKNIVFEEVYDTDTSDFSSGCTSYGMDVEEGDIVLKFYLTEEIPLNYYNEMKCIDKAVCTIASIFEGIENYLLLVNRFKITL